ncbi:interferon-inducible GTPase 5-like [Danio aesculapii]|uniref:interferon-inducible GTPase 5-like n=1 Tax=Danio aesculapii TaxID=1142201 RepID=UPI0024C0C43D|nr:interferon-inducible GTPase 5-like [Danio aesculapii]
MVIHGSESFIIQNCCLCLLAVWTVKKILMAMHEDESKMQMYIHDLNEFVSNRDLPTAISKIQEYHKNQDLVELNIGVTGGSGSGKSSFVNAFRGLEDDDELSAKTGVVETTMEPEAYIHPKYDNVKVWDLPGIGTPKFKADEYLQKIDFKNFDFFIIIASDRFTECHTQLAKEITRMGKKFYFVRSKIDTNIDAEKRKKNFDLKKTLDIIREDCETGLKKIDIEDPVVFLISRFALGEYDFDLLEKRMEKELPQHKRHVLMLTLPNITQEINNKKKKALEENIAKVAFLSACVAAFPIPGLSAAVDLAIIAAQLKKYYSAFDLDDPSLEKLSERSGKPVEELKNLMKSPFRHGIDKETIKILLNKSFLTVSLSAVEYTLSFIPIIGSVMAGGKSYIAVSSLLNSALNEIAEDAKNVLMASVQA